MVVEDGRDRDRTSGEEEAPDLGGEEPVAPTPIVGGEATEQAGAGVEAAEAAEVEVAAEAAAESVEKTEGEAEASAEAASGAAEEGTRVVYQLEPRVAPYPKATDSKGQEYTYQEVKRRIVGKRSERPAEPKEPPKPKEKEEKEVKEKEEKEEWSEETAKGKGKKGKAKNPNWRPRSEEGERYRRVKGLLRLLDKRGGRVEDLPEHLQELIHSFGPGGPSSGSGVARPAAKPRPSAPVPEPEEEPYWRTLSDVPEPDPAVVDQRKVTSGRLRKPAGERKEEDSEPAGEPIRLRSRSRVRAYASRVVERSRTKPEDKKPVFVTETVPNLTRPKKRPAAAKPEPAAENLPEIRQGEQRGPSLE